MIVSATGGPPSAVSVTPASGSGAAQTFSLAFSDPRGYALINTVQVVFNKSLAAANACFLFYQPASNLIYLSVDAGNSWLGPVTPGHSGTLQNTQCTVDGLNSSASGSGTNLTLNLAITFQSAFAGSKNVYMDVYDATGDSGWQQRGTWTVPAAGGPPSAVSVTPASGSGATQTFSFVFSDPRGNTAINTAQIVFNNSLSAYGACFLYYQQAANLVYIANDAGNSWTTSVTPGGSGIIQNSQCSLDAAASSVSRSGTTLTLNLALTFKAGFSGTKYIYMEVNDAAGDSGWQQRGSWIAP
jgi:hypothetical protein